MREKGGKRKGKGRERDRKGKGSEGTSRFLLHSDASADVYCMVQESDKIDKK